MEDDSIRPVITYLNRFLHDIWLRTGGGDDDVGSAITKSSRGVSPIILDLNRRVGSGDPLTCDTDSFTVDSTELYCDMDEA
jgi:hypothetical protein